MSLTDVNYKKLDDLNQNIILLMEKNEDIVKKVEGYFRENYNLKNDSKSKSVKYIPEVGVISVSEVTGDSVTFASGQSVE